MAGFIELERARVRWFLSTDIADLPLGPVAGGPATFRSITMDGQAVEFSDGFAGLHTRVYEEVLAGRGFGIEDSRPAIELASRIRGAPVNPIASRLHPMLSVAQH